MTKRFLFICLAAVAAATISMFGCSREDRDNAVNRMGRAAKALNGEVRPDDVEHDTPNIVATQQRRERIRQNTKWTAENQALHPIEYCQAQLDELDRYSRQLEVSKHKLLTNQNTVRRKLAENEAQIRNIGAFLDSAKKAYRKAEAANQWPMALNGFSLSKAKAQEKIVDAAQKLPQLKNQVAAQRSMLAALERKSAKVSSTQKQLVVTREKVQSTITDLNTKKAIDGDKGIIDALQAINDSMGSLGDSVGNPNLEDLIPPDSTSSHEAAFRAIMAE